MGRKKIEYKKPCTVCKKEFEPGRHRSKLTCSAECLKTHRDNTKDARMEASLKSIKEKYNAEHPSKIKGFADKVKKTKLEKYGSENYNNRKKAEKTNKKRYGGVSPTSDKSVLEKVKKTKLKNHGNENYNNREKAKETNIKNIGVEHHMQKDESINKMKETNKEKYGVEYSLLLEKAKENLKKSNQENYGSDFFFSSDEYINKTREETIKNIKNLLSSHNLEFDENKYIKLRTKESGSLKYFFYEIKCNVCNTIFTSRLINKIPICRTCYPIAANSIIEMEFREFLKSENIFFNTNKKDIIAPLELDIYIPEISLAIEINGNYFHSELGGCKDKYYHLLKSQMCFEKGIKLIHIFEDEWYEKKDIIISRILNMMKKTKTKIFARNCEIKKITNDEKDKFLSENHMQGKSIDKIRYGLFNNNELVSVMSFSSERKALGNKKKEENSFELIRFANKKNVNVVGAFSKLLKAFIKIEKPKKIISYADMRWSGMDYKNTVYFKNGFSFIDYTKPNYFYMEKKDYLKRMHRFSLRKDILLKKFPDANPEKSEWQIAMKNGYDRIWDCGNMKFVINL